MIEAILLYWAIGIAIFIWAFIGDDVPEVNPPVWHFLLLAFVWPLILGFAIFGGDDG